MLLFGSQSPRKGRRTLTPREAGGRDDVHFGYLCHGPLTASFTDPYSSSERGDCGAGRQTSEDTTILRWYLGFPGRNSMFPFWPSAATLSYAVLTTGYRGPSCLCPYSASFDFVLTPRHSQGQIHDVLPSALIFTTPATSLWQLKASSL